MEIVLNLTNDEIENALLTYVGSSGIDMEGKTTAMTITSGRKGNGLRAEIVITPIGEAVDVPVNSPSKGIMREVSEDDERTSPLELDVVVGETEKPSETASLFASTT